MSINADHAPEAVIIIDKKSRSLKDVQDRIAELRRDLPDIDAQYNAASIQHANVHSELDVLTNALTSSGYPVEPNSPQ